MSLFKAIRHPHKAEHVPDPYANVLVTARQAIERRRQAEAREQQQARSGR